MLQKNFAEISKQLCRLEFYYDKHEYEKLLFLFGQISCSDLHISKYIVLIMRADELGERLEENEKFRTFASLCYVCSGNIDKFVRCWDKLQPSSENNDKNCDSIQVMIPIGDRQNFTSHDFKLKGNCQQHQHLQIEIVLTLQDVVEKMLVLLRVVEARKQERITPSFGETAADKLAKYAATIAAQGQLSAAMEILPQASDKVNYKRTLYLALYRWCVFVYCNCTNLSCNTYGKQNCNTMEYC